MDWEKWGRESKNREWAKISAEEKWNQIRMKSIWQKLCISGNHFSPRQNVILRYCWGVKMSSGGRGLQSKVREIWSQCLSPSQTQCILSDWQGWLLIICLSWLPSEKKMQRCSLTLEGHWSQEQLISTGERLHTHTHTHTHAPTPLSLTLPVSPTALCWRQTGMRNPLFSAQKSGSLSRGDGAKLQKAHVIEQP